MVKSKAALGLFICAASYLGWMTLESAERQGHTAPLAPSARTAHPKEAPHVPPQDHARNINQEKINTFGRAPSLSGMERGVSPNQNAPQHPVNKSGRSLTKDQMKQFFQQLKRNKGYVQNIHADNKSIHANNPKNLVAAKNAKSQFQKNHPNHLDWFKDNFFQAHNDQPYYHQQGSDWWQGSGWDGMTSWLGWNEEAPEIYGEDNTMEEPIGTNEYPAPEGGPGQEGWLPIGVFAAARDPSSAAYSDFIVQLAIDRQGDIAGTYYNSATDQTHPLEGSVDGETRQAVWKVADSLDSPLMVASLYNLTQEEVPVQVHFTQDNVEPWVFVRLNE